jgi:hypothetical protein
MKRRNPNWGCPRIAQQIALALSVEIDKDIVRRILSVHYRPESGGPSWLTFLGHTKDSLWSCDLFRCSGIVDGVALCRMFHRAIRGQRLAKYLSSDHDPLYRFHQWQANLRVLEVTEIKTVPYVPLSHPFVERLIGTVRREYLDRTLFWTTADLETKLFDFQHYYNGHRTHAGLKGGLPEPRVDGSISSIDDAIKRELETSSDASLVKAVGDALVREVRLPRFGDVRLHHRPSHSHRWRAERWRIERRIRRSGRRAVGIHARIVTEYIAARVAMEIDAMSRCTIWIYRYVQPSLPRPPIGILRMNGRSSPSWRSAWG